MAEIDVLKADLARLEQLLLNSYERQAVAGNGTEVETQQSLKFAIEQAKGRITETGIIPNISKSTNQIINDILEHRIIAPAWFVNNNINWVITGHISEQEFLTGYYNLIEQGIIQLPLPDIPLPEIEEPVFEILPEAAAEIDISINDKMITQKVNDFEIINGRVKGSITFMITDQFNPYYYNKEIINYLQLRDKNGVTLVLKRNVLKFSETEIDETIFYDESSHEISKIFANSLVWDRDTQPTPFSTKLEFIIEVGKLPDITPITAGFMGAGGLGAVAVLVLIGAAFTIKGD